MAPITQPAELPQAKAAAEQQAVSQASSVIVWAEMPAGKMAQVTSKANGRAIQQAIQLPTRR